jgi:hypothetical protein
MPGRSRTDAHPGQSTSSVTAVPTAEQWRDLLSYCCTVDKNGSDVADQHLLAAEVAANGWYARQ